MRCKKMEQRLSLDKAAPPNSLYELAFSPEGAALVVLLLFGLLVVLRYVAGADGSITPQAREQWEKHQKRFRTKDAAEYVRGAAEDAAAIKHKRQLIMQAQREIVEVDTNLGPCRATVVGNKRAKIAIVTLHDVATNWHHCFTNLQREVVDERFFDVFNFVHVNIVGHEEHAKFGSDTSAMSLESLAQMLHSVVLQLELSYFVMMGVGAGANVALRYASNHVGNVRGLILINPLVQAANGAERRVLQNLAGTINANAWEKAADTVADFHFTRSYLQTNPRIRDSLHVSLQNMNDRAVKHYINAALDRDAVDTARLASLSDTPALCIGGGVSRGYWTSRRADNTAEIRHLQSLLGERTFDAVMDGHLSGIPTEEDPATFALAVKFFLDQI